MVSSLLGVGHETVKYWKNHLDPVPHRTGGFSNKDILCYRVFKFLIRKKHLPVKVLKLFHWQDVFESIHSTPLDQLTSKTLIINEGDYTIVLMDECHVVKLDNDHEHLLGLKRVIEEQMDAYLAYGEPQGAPALTAVPETTAEATPPKLAG